jgi:pyruvate-formate lyase-activating enzyme
MSIKAYDDSIHRVYTGETNKSVLNNFRLLSESRIKPIAESVLIPGLVEQSEIEKIAKFIASINPAIPYRVDGFFPSHRATWRSPSPEEVISAVEIAKKHLWCVHYLHCATVNNERNVLSVYPQIK